MKNDAASPQSESWRLIAEHSRDLFLLLDLDGKITYASPSNLPLLGRDPRDLIGKRVADFIHPDDRHDQHAAFRRRIETGTSQSVELRVLKSDGGFLVVESVGVPIRNSDGHIEAVLISGRDISDRKAWEDELRTREERLRILIEHAPAFLWTTDTSLRFTSAVGGALPKLQVDANAFTGTSLFEFFQTDDPELPPIAAHRRALNGQIVDYTIEWAGLFYHAHVEPLVDDRGRVIGVTGVALDVTAQRMAERKLERSEERYRLIFERNLAGVYRSTLDGRLLECNPALARMLGYDSVEELLQVPTWELYFSPQQREEQIADLAEQTVRHNFELCLRKKNGSPLWVLQSDALVYDEDDHALCSEGTLIDITDRKNAEERIEHQAYHDHLTDLPNRLLFNDRLSLAVAHARRQRERLTVMFLDLDHFKLINDTMAHSAGDALLRSVAATLQALVRSEDTVARMGGDEFTILLPDVRNENEAAKLAQRILSAFTRPFFIQGREVFISASIGISMFPSDGDDPEALIKNADAAMYRAKDAGRNTFHFHTPMAQHRAEARLSMETALRHALEREELHLEYQPQVSLVTGLVVGVEALIRWVHPERGLIPPKEFIGVAEEIGLILPIGEWVLMTACRQLAAWRRAGMPRLRVSVNLSARQFQSPALVSFIAQLLSTTSLDADLLDLEITESLAIRDIDLTIAFLRRIRAMGMSASLDDFGTGYSSLSYLKRLPIDRLKIDQLFVREIAASRMDETITDAIIKMAHSMGLIVVAEGVEETAQREILRNLGCDEMQGFLFSRALPPDALVPLLTR